MFRIHVSNKLKVFDFGGSIGRGSSSLSWDFGEGVPLARRLKMAVINQNRRKRERDTS